MNFKLFINFLSVTFLIAGTCIGGGMIALPVATGVSGFFPSFITILLSWFFMTVANLFLLEASFLNKDQGHIITLSSHFLGRWGKWIAWMTYLFIMYASLVAYIAEGGAQVSSLVNVFCESSFPSQEIIWAKWQGCIAFAGIFGIVLCFNRFILGRVNGILFVSMVAAYFVMLYMGCPHVQTENLFHRQWETSLYSLPLMLALFSFPGIVLSLKPYFKERPNLIKGAVVLGTTLSLLAYLLWEYVVLGTVPLTGEFGLQQALEKGEEAGIFIRVVANPWLFRVAIFFSFFAIVTSFLGLGLALIDSLRDGLKLSRKPFASTLIVLLVVVPSLIFALSYPRAFISALDISGGYGDSILSLIFPALMVWVGRYQRKLQGWRTPGGRPLLLLVIFFALGVILLETLPYLSS